MQTRENETIPNRLYDVITLLQLAHFASEKEAKFVIRVARHALVPILDELNQQGWDKIAYEADRRMLAEIAKETMHEELIH